MNNTVEKFFALLRYAVGADDVFPQIDAGEWQEVYAMAQSQTVLGLLFEGLRSNKADELHIPKSLLLKWYAQSEQIKKQNILLNQRCVELVRQLREDGFRCCILKGQGNAAMYPNPYSRTSGDIDVWVSGKAGRREVIRYAAKALPHADVRIYHVEYEYKGVPVELHFMPGVMNNPFYNKHIQRWYSERMEAQCNHHVELPDGAGAIPVPTMTFNLVYQLAHMMHHFFDEGIGLRQMADYYFLLRHAPCTEVDAEATLRHFPCTEVDAEATLRHLGLRKFSGAVMYVMREVFHLEEQHMIVPVDERRGPTLLGEIVRGGNFGKHSGLTNHSAGAKYFLKHWRNMHFICEYPAEALCEPFFRTWHFFWRLRMRA